MFGVESKAELELNWHLLHAGEANVFIPCSCTIYMYACSGSKSNNALVFDVCRAWAAYLFWGIWRYVGLQFWRQPKCFHVVRCVYVNRLGWRLFHIFFFARCIPRPRFFIYRICWLHPCRPREWKGQIFGADSLCTFCSLEAKSALGIRVFSSSLIV